MFPNKQKCARVCTRALLANFIPNNTIAFEKSEKNSKESVSDTIKKYENENKRNFQHRKGIKDEVKNR